MNPILAIITGIFMTNKIIFYYSNSYYSNAYIIILITTL